MAHSHSFHIPVMGIGFTIDTPAKVAHFGISSTISLIDDVLIEKMREMYSKEYKFPFQPITEKVADFRAKRITSYLNLMDEIVKSKFEALKASVLEKGKEWDKFLELLPDFSDIKSALQEASNHPEKRQEIWSAFMEKLKPGSIDVNIMTKLDKENYLKKEKLPREYNDAHAALRGFAQSTLSSSIILSAGLNPRLYSYFEQFEDFYPNEAGEIKKQIVLKVSDFRSAMVQGKFFAKKGLWVSEYRIESGLNCGGHAFSTGGYLLGPILEAFKEKREELISDNFELYQQALAKKGRFCPESAPALRVTAQGGVGSSDEHAFLLDHYKLDSIGWGSPFLLVPEAVNIDGETQEKLCAAKEKDLYLSHISPLGVPFNSLRGNTKDLQKQAWIDKGRPGSPCPREFAVSSKEFTDQPICTASRQYQHLKLQQLESSDLDPVALQKESAKVMEKACLCVGLVTATLKANDLNHKVEGKAVAVCPGPNLAYFSKLVSLKEMIDHIYGRAHITRLDRPNVFVKEIKLNIDYLGQQMMDLVGPVEDRQLKTFLEVKKNLSEGITYYKDLFSRATHKLSGLKEKLQNDLNALEQELGRLPIIGKENVQTV